MQELNETNNETTMQIPPSVKTYNPLTDEPVIENPNVLKSFSNEQDFSNIRLGEQEFVPPPIADTTQQTVKPKEAPKPINEQLNDVSQKEKEKAAKIAANAILEGYGWVWSKANGLLRISNSKIKKLEKEDLIDTNAKIPIGSNGDIVRLGEAIRQFNEMGGNPFEVTEEFKDEVRPVLTRVLAKRGVGMTDEQYLMYLFGKDIAEKLIIFKDLWKQRNDYINALIEGYKTVKEISLRQNTPPAPTYNTSNVQTEAIRTEQPQHIKEQPAPQPTVTVVNEPEIVEAEAVELTKDGFPKRKRGRKPIKKD